MSLVKLYNMMPAVCQNFIVSGYGFFNDRRRYGAHFFRELEQCMDRSAWSSEAIRSFQRLSLSGFLLHAQRSEFWAKRFAAYGVDVEGDPYSEISKLPLLTKAEVRENAKDIVIRSSGIQEKSTSGSTGSGLQFWGCVKSDAAQWAVWWRYWGAFGIERGIWCAHFGGKNIIPITRKKKPFYRTNYPSKQIMFSAYHLSPDTVGDYVRALNKMKPVWIHGYASVIAELARLAMRFNLKLSYRVKWISLGSENVTQMHEENIAEFFGVRPIQHYGLAEGVANFSSKPNMDGLYVDEDFSYVEFVRENNLYKVVGTNFTNYAFPLIRYDTGDLASDVEEVGFPRKVGGLDGRQDDYIQLPSGERIGRLAQVFNDFDFVDESQLVQKSLGLLVVNIVKNCKWDEDSEGRVRDQLRSKLGSDIDVEFNYVDAVVRTASGKVRFVISEV